jgi:hypothetical protein
MEFTGTTLHDRIPVVSVILYLADYGVMFNGNIWLGMSVGLLL